MGTLTKILGPDRMWKLTKEARLSSLCGVSVDSMTNKEHLAVIGYMAEQLEKHTQVAKDILEKVSDQPERS